MTADLTVGDYAMAQADDYATQYAAVELLAKEQGMARVTANIYAFNTQSQRMFRSVGFAQTDKEWYAYTF